MNTTPVIAVFGSTKVDTLTVAELIGYEIARQNCVLLTGGKSGEGERVSEKAIAGAKKAAKEGNFAPWLGVARDESMKDSDPSEDSRSYVIHPGFDHKRNYIEACLCDVAIALEGEKGTRSEVTFCLSLQKPVVFVGNNWEKTHPLTGSDKDNTLDRLVREAFELVGKGPSGNSTLDQLLNGPTIRENLTKSPLTRRYYLVSPNQDWSSEVTRIKREWGFFKGEFPHLVGERYETMKNKYAAWLAEVRKRLSAADDQTGRE